MFAKSFFKRVGDFLEVADQKTTDSDLQTLTKEVAGVAGGALEKAAGDAAGKVKNLDLGLLEGFNELTNQIGTDLKGFKSGFSPGGQQQIVVAPKFESPATAADESQQTSTSRELPQKARAESKLSQKLGDLRERILELESRETDRVSHRDKLQSRFLKVDEQLQKLHNQAKQMETTDDPCGTCQVANSMPEAVLAEHQARKEAMCQEFRKLQASADAKLMALETELTEVSAASGPLQVELDFWREKTQRMLALRGLSEVPDDIVKRVQRSEHDTENNVQEITGVPCTLDGLEQQTDGPTEDTLRQEEEFLEHEYTSQQRTHKDLEHRLQELMRESEAAMERVQQERRQGRELEAAKAAADSLASAEAAAAAAAERKALEAQQLKADIERRCSSELHILREARPQAHVQNEEVAALRSEASVLKKTAEDLVTENRILQGRLHKCRAAAAADLERAVPLSDPSCWQTIDVPVMKVVTLLVRSTCLRRTYAVHLVAMYAWLFFLLFWLEKH